MRTVFIGVLAAAFNLVGSAEGTRWVLAPSGGMAYLDKHLADYGWDTTVRPVWGLELSRLASGNGIGVRTQALSTHQEIYGLGADDRTSVTLRTFHIFGEHLLASPAKLEISGGASIGGHRISYSPDHSELSIGGSESVPVDFPAIHDWSATAGLTIRRPVAEIVLAAVSLERHWMRLETAHRVASEVATENELFSNWIATISFSWILGGKQGATP